MNHPLRQFLLPAFLSLAFAAPFALAQPQPPTPNPTLNENFATLADQPATHTAFSFDRSMLQIAQNLLASGGMDANHAAAALTGISVDNYRYPQPAFYTPETMNAIIDSFHAAGWKHLVNGNQTPANEAQPHSAITDVWLHFSGADIDHMTVLVRSTKELNLIQVAGDLRPLDLIHLSGHFGIPKVDPSAVMVPAPDGK